MSSVATTRVGIDEQARQLRKEIESLQVGAGAITANFPHQANKPKGRTKIGKNVRTGIQNGFVAPVEIGDGAWVAAGTVVTKDVPADALAVARTRQENKEGYATRRRND